MRPLIVGAILSVLGLGAYVVGLFAAYPGRGFSLTSVMVGLTLLAIGRSGVGNP